jgi:ethanolamine utilization protein EutN
MEVQIMKNGVLTEDYVIAVDCGVGAGIGEVVLLTTGSSARLALRTADVPTDAVIVGIVD